MSIYLEFPAIAEYPFYTNPFKNDQEIFYPEEEKKLETIEEKNIIQDYILLRMV